MLEKLSVKKEKIWTEKKIGEKSCSCPFPVFSEYALPCFFNLKRSKQLKIINTAVTHFSEKGYRAASVNSIAKDAGISIGGLYRYFASKKELFRYLTECGTAILSEFIGKFSEGMWERNFKQNINLLVSATIEYALQYPHFNKLYLKLGQMSDSEILSMLGGSLERAFMDFYPGLILSGIKGGELSSGSNTKNLAYLLDNDIMSLQQVLCGIYQGERFRQYFGFDPLSDLKRLGKVYTELILKHFS